jgi:hypothetical protein
MARTGAPSRQSGFNVSRAQFTELKMPKLRHDVVSDSLRLYMCLLRTDPEFTCLKIAITQTGKSHFCMI